MSLLRRSMELGLGALLLTKDAAEQLVRDLAEKDEPVADAGVGAEDLRRRAQRFAEELAQAVKEDVDQALAAAGMVRREEYEQLQARVAALEARLAADAAGFEPTSEF
jgi:polyhydroxyalkanoate synthesis regulator phasin